MRIETPPAAATMKFKLTDLEPGHWIALTVELVIFIISLTFAWYGGREDLIAFAVSGIVTLTGLTLGGLAGALASPRTDELGQFAEYKKTLGAFLSGFALSKIDAIR